MKRVLTARADAFLGAISSLRGGGSFGRLNNLEQMILEAVISLVNAKTSPYYKPTNHHPLEPGQSVLGE